ncbi:MAG: hypothetical protein M1300_12245, partial [Epsilonproteobacteria bacterium]|nr:hypothetical protein [Campylobacterota bacterium]
MKRTLLIVTYLLGTVPCSPSDINWFDFFKAWGEFNSQNRAELFQQHKKTIDPVLFEVAENTREHRILHEGPTLYDLRFAVPQAVFDLKDFIENAET